MPSSDRSQHKLGRREIRGLAGLDLPPMRGANSVGQPYETEAVNTSSSRDAGSEARRSVQIGWATLSNAAIPS